jgi:hypothetical protein
LKTTIDPTPEAPEAPISNGIAATIEATIASRKRPRLIVLIAFLMCIPSSLRSAALDRAACARGF